MGEIREVVLDSSLSFPENKEEEIRFLISLKNIRKNNFSLEIKSLFFLKLFMFFFLCENEDQDSCAMRK